MILEKTKFSISKQLVFPIIAAQKCKKEIFGRNFWHFWMSITQTHLIKALYSLDSWRQNERLTQNPKTEGFRELFLPENDFKTCSKVNFPKKHLEFGGLETNQRHEILTWIFFTCPSTYEFNIVFWTLNRNIFKLQ